MRVVVLTVIPQVAASYTDIVRAAGHEVPAVIVPRTSAFAKEHVEGNPPGLDVLFAEGKSSLPRLLRAYEPDVGLCTGFPWLVTQEALDVPRLGIVNGHPSLLPRYRGPFPLAWAERNGTRVRVVRTSLSEVPGAERLDCADGPLWLVETVPLEGHAPRPFR